MQNKRAIGLLLLANSISGVAQGISMLAVPWYFTGIIHREELFGKAYFVVTTLSLLWGLYAGAIIDRYNRRRIFLGINMVGLAVISSIAITGYWQQGLPWPLVISVFGVTALIYNIHFPNLYAYAQEITPKEQYGRITSMLEIQGQLTFTLAGAFAAVLLKGIDGHLHLFGTDFNLPFHIRPWKIYEIFAVNAFTYLVAFAIILRIKSLPVVDRHIDTSSLRERVKVGFSFLRKHPLLLHFGNASLLIFLTIIVFGTYVMAVYVKQFLKMDGDVYAVADMSFSFGALLAGLLTQRLFGERNVVGGIIMLSALAGLMYAVMIFNTILAVFFLAQFVIGACNAAIRIQRITFLFHHVPNHVIGRANSIFFVMNVAQRLCLIALFTLPFFHRHNHIIYATGIMAFICMLGAGMLLYFYRDLEKLKTVA